LANSGGYHVILRDIYFELSILFQKRGDAREANNYLTRHLELKDSILSEGALTAIGEMRIRYEIERSKERQEYLESILEERNRTTLVLLILVVFFLGGGASIGFLFLRQKRLGRLLQVSNDELGKINLQLQKSNEALTLANETKTKLFSIIGHDLKSPFVSILGFSELLKDEADGMRNREISDLTEKILGSSVKLVDLVNNLTSWALQQREMLKPQPVFFGMEEVATVVMKAAMLNMELKGIVVRGEFGRPDVVFADREMISTVLRNILTNAIKFSFEGGEIVVRGEYLGEIYRVTIEDRGVGMSEDTIRNILYGSGTISTYGTANEKGTGLGLSVSRDFIRDNGGRLDIISEPGKGSSFIVEVPTS
ncbi:MAG: sensor histidine kinase, partial [Chlorobiota bacterium]